MEKLQVLLNFLEQVKDDYKINAIEISLFIAVYQKWVKQNCINPIGVCSSEIMPVAKISSSKTYYKALSALNEYGYLKYLPSNANSRKSKVYLKI